MEGGVRMTEESIISGIPIYTYEDYINSTTPYEYAYQYIDDSFTLERVVTQMSNNAREVYVKNFRKIFSEYVKKKKKLTKPIALDSVTQFEGQALELSCGAGELTSLEYLLKRTMEKNLHVIIRFYRFSALSILIQG